MNELATLDKRKSIATLISQDEHDKLCESVKAALSAPEFNFVVTEESLKTAKTAMADLNKIKTQIKDFSKFKVDQESDSINKFKGNFKEFENLCQAKRDEIENNVRVFEDKERAKHKEAGDDYLAKKFEELSIRDEFRGYDFPLSISAFNSDGSKLAKKFIDILDEIIDKAEGSQAKEDLRLANEEIEKQKEIERRVAEQRERDRIADQKRADEAMQRALEEQRIEIEKAAAAKTEQPLAEEPVQQKEEVPLPPVEQPAVETEKTVRFEALFDVTFPSKYNNDQIINIIDTKLKKAGFSDQSLVSIKAL